MIAFSLVLSLLSSAWMGDVSLAEETKDIESAGEQGVEIEERTTRSGDIEINEENFPDANFRILLGRSEYDQNRDGKLSAAEIADITELVLPFIGSTHLAIADLTGIKLLTSLQSLDCGGNHTMTIIDVAGMPNLKRVMVYRSNQVAVIDFRNCPKLESGEVPNQGEKVYISAGMLDYAIAGNLVIDLKGDYTRHSDGSKTVDLRDVISPALMTALLESVVANTQFDATTRVLTIPAGEAITTIQVRGRFSSVTYQWTFYPEMTNVDDCIVMFDTQGGSVVDAQIIEKGTMISEPSAQPIKNGYLFRGWYNEATCESLFDFGVPIAADATAYAKWDEGYLLTFDTQGGSTIDAWTVEKNTVASKPSAPTKEGHVFLGWYQEATCENMFDFGMTITADTVMYAKWVVGNHVLIFDTQGGSLVESQVFEVEYDSGGEYIYPQIPDWPTKTGYFFGGWYRDATYESIDNLHGIMQCSPGTSTTLYAKWVVEPDYVVTFDTQGGSAIDAQMLAWAMTVFEPKVPPTKAGYFFDGWYQDAEGTRIFYFSNIVYNDITLYAKWHEGYVVTFDTQGGSAIDAQIVEKNTTANEPIVEPTNPGYVFGGWYQDAACKNVFIFSRRINTDTTVYAKWTPAQRQIEINEVNFPDENFRAQLSQSGYDRNSDGWLSETEIADIITLNVWSSVADITGIKFLTSLNTLTCSSENMTIIDVAGMQNLSTVNYGNCLQLTTLDFRDCPNLRVGWHSTRGEKVYISAGMTRYIGCASISEHTGNIVIDLQGFYTKHPDGSKTVDLKGIISPALIDVLYADKDVNNNVYDATTNILTIPAGEGTTSLQAGRTDDNLPTRWTFYSEMTNVDDCVVTFDVQGGSVIDAQIIVKNTVASEPSPPPTRAGYTFGGWYQEATCENEFDFGEPITADTKVYARWIAIVTEYTVTFDTQGGSSIVAQTIVKNALASEPSTPPTRVGYTFGGWYQEATCENEFDFGEPITADTKVYAKWIIENNPTNEAPVIIAADQSLKVGDVFDPLKEVLANDKEDGDITGDIIIISNNVDMTKAGSYTITYQVTNSKGVITEKTITVIVSAAAIAPPKPGEPNTPNTPNESVELHKPAQPLSPQTGDSVTNIIWLALSAIALLAVAVSDKIRRKRYN